MAFSNFLLAQLPFDVESALNQRSLNERELQDLEDDEIINPNAPSEISIEHITYHSLFKCQRDTLVQVMRMEAVTTSCLLLASRRATVVVANGTSPGEAPIASYALPRNGKSGPSLCDAVLMEDASAVAFAMSDRTILFYDTSCSRRSDAAQEHRHAWRMIGLKNCITSLWYHPSNRSDPCSALYLGDEQGNVTTLTFLQPRLLLFGHRVSDSHQAGGAETIYWLELFEGAKSMHAAFARARTQRRVHAEPVLQLFFCETHQVLISCSLDARTSMKLTHADRRLPSYKFSVEMGVRRFAFNAQRFEIVSASDDGILRIWNPLVPKCPVLAFQAHDAPIVDVSFSGKTMFSVCKNAEMRIWDEGGALAKKVQLELPTTSKWSGTRNIFLGDGKNVLVSLGPNLAEIGLGDPTTFRSSPEEIESVSSQSSSAPRFSTQLHEEKQEFSEFKTEESLTDFANSIESASTVPHLPISAVEIFRERMSNKSDGPEKTTTPGINERIEVQERIMAKRRYFVEECAPHLALSLSNPETIAHPRVPKLVLQTDFKF